MIISINEFKKYFEQNTSNIASIKLQEIFPLVEELAQDSVDLVEFYDIEDEDEEPYIEISSSFEDELETTLKGTIVWDNNNNNFLVTINENNDSRDTDHGDINTNNIKEMVDFVVEFIHDMKLNLDIDDDDDDDDDDY